MKTAVKRVLSFLIFVNYFMKENGKKSEWHAFTVHNFQVCKRAHLFTFDQTTMGHPSSSPVVELWLLVEVKAQVPMCAVKLRPRE